MTYGRPYQPTLHLKTRETQQHFVEVRENIREIVPQAWVDHLIEQAVNAVQRAILEHGSAAYAWSAGKDSLALEVVMREAGVLQGFASLTPLEWPAQLAWALEHKPAGVVRAPQEDVNLAWLSGNRHLLFPDAVVGTYWAKVWHKAQNWYHRHYRPGVIFNGRRRSDGNHTPDEPHRLKNGQLHLTPLAYWTHEDVMATVDYYSEWPPVYAYPNSFLRGTGPLALYLSSACWGSGGLGIRVWCRPRIGTGLRLGTFQWRRY